MLIFVILFRVPPISPLPLTTSTANHSDTYNSCPCDGTQSVMTLGYKEIIFILTRQRLVRSKQSQLQGSGGRKWHGLVGGGSEKGQPK